jgi:hypothetical protein
MSWRQFVIWDALSLVDVICVSRQHHKHCLMDWCFCSSGRQFIEIMSAGCSRVWGGRVVCPGRSFFGMWRCVVWPRRWIAACGARVVCPTGAQFRFVVGTSDLNLGGPALLTLFFKFVSKVCYMSDESIENLRCVEGFALHPLWSETTSTAATNVPSNIFLQLHGPATALNRKYLRDLTTGRHLKIFL